MDRNSKLILLAAAAAFILGAALVLSFITLLVIICASLLISGLFFALSHFTPEEEKKSNARPPSAGRVGPFPPSRVPTVTPVSQNQRTPTGPSVLPPQNRIRQASYTEQQWAALTKALKSGSRNRLPVAPGVAEEKPSTRPNSGNQENANKQLREQLLKRQDEIGVLLARTRERKREKEIWLRENPHLASPEAGRALHQIQLILDALDKRFQKTHQLLSGGTFSPDMAYDLLESPMALEENSVQHLRTAVTLRPLLPGQWEASINKLFKSLESQSPLNEQKVPGPSRP